MYDDNNMQNSDGTYRYTAETQSYRQKKKNGTGKLVALALVFSLLGGCIGAGGTLLASEIRGRHAEEAVPGISSDSESSSTPAAPDTPILYESVREPETVNSAKPVNGSLMSVSEVYAANVNSTVGITTSGMQTNYWGYKSSFAASGSGFIISADGYILTNYHVVEDSSSITVATYNGNNYDAALIGFDEANDIAVLKINTTELEPVIIGNSDSLLVGEDVIAIGNPLGELTFSLTKGVVSAMNREITFSSGNKMNLIQTDCAINSGNSGGALFNMYGEVVGITNAKYSSNSGSGSIDNIGFAIPINQVREIISNIIAKGYNVKPYIGVTVSDVSSEAQAYGVPVGAAVKSLVDGAPAALAGLRENDVIIAFNDVTIESSADLTAAVGAAQPGETVTLTVFRYGEGEQLKIELVIGETIASVSSSAPQPESNQSEDSSGSYFFSNPFGFGGLFPFF